MAETLDDVCRDYLRNVCTRGKKCRFSHPPQTVPSFNTNPKNAIDERVKFCRMTCHDFQNDVCERDECKFMHINKEDQEQFIATGIVSPLLLDEAIKTSVIPFLMGETPVCKNYLSGECRRGKACKFRHLSHCKYRKELEMLFGVGKVIRIDSNEVEPKRLKPSHAACLPFSSCIPSAYPQVYFPMEKCTTNNFPPNCHAQPQTSHVTSQCMHEEHLTSLQKENTILRKQMLDLKKQLSDLAAANEFLLDQNAGLRMGRKPNGTVAVTLQPPVTVQPLPPVQPQQIAVAATLPVSIASVPAQPMTLSTVAANATVVPAVSCSAATAQQLMAVSTMTVAAAGQPHPAGTAPTATAAILAPVPAVSVPPATHAPQLVPVSIAAVSMAPMPGTSTATSLVSYPIMTQAALLQTSLNR